jgi:hypothetical protein
VDAPTKGDMGCVSREKKVIKGDDKKLSKRWKQRLFTINKEIKNNFG